MSKPTKEQLTEMRAALAAISDFDWNQNWADDSDENANFVYHALHIMPTLLDYVAKLERVADVARDVARATLWRGPLNDAIDALDRGGGS